MPVKTTIYQRIFHSDSFLSPISFQSRHALARRGFSDRLCLLLSLILMIYCGWYLFGSSHHAFPFLRDRIEQSAYSNAIRKSIPIIENKQLCSLNEVHLIFLIISSNAHVLERQSIRETWTSMPDLFGIHSQRLFVVGYQPGGRFYKDLSKEAAHEQDLLYLTVDDNSVTLKELHAYRWLQQHCSNTKYIFKTEDDLFVNSFLLHELVRELQIDSTHVKDRFLYNVSIDRLFLSQIDDDVNRFLFGWAFQPGRPERNLTYSPYYVTYAEYSKEHYPRYCSGFGYMMNAKTCSLLANEGFKVKRPFRFSDIFITGILPESLNFVCETLPFTFHQGTADKCVELIRSHNAKAGSISLPPVVVCSTGRHIGQSSYSDYHRVWATLKNIYADRLH